MSRFEPVASNDSRSPALRLSDASWCFLRALAGWGPLRIGDPDSLIAVHSLVHHSLAKETGSLDGKAIFSVTPAGRALAEAGGR